MMSRTQRVGASVLLCAMGLSACMSERAHHTSMPITALCVRATFQSDREQFKPVSFYASGTELPTPFQWLSEGSPHLFVELSARADHNRLRDANVVVTEVLSVRDLHAALRASVENQRMLLEMSSQLGVRGPDFSRLMPEFHSAEEAMAHASQLRTERAEGTPIDDMLSLRVKDPRTGSPVGVELRPDVDPRRCLEALSTRSPRTL